MIPREVAALVPWSRILEETGVDPGRRGRTYCPIHKGDNPHAFIFDGGNSRAHCFACGWHGDKLDFLQTVLGVDFKTALSRIAELAGVRLDNRKLDPAELRRIRAHRVALDLARNAYGSWQRHKFHDLVKFKFQELLPEIEAAEIAYRALCRKPGLYSFAEQSSWIRHLGALYDQQAQIENDLDILVYREHEKTRMGWWREETERVAA